MTDVNQPRIEMVLGTPLQVEREEDEVIVEVRDEKGERIELKRFNDPTAQ